jgi:hypothetical protein
MTFIILFANFLCKKEERKNTQLMYLVLIALAHSSTSVFEYILKGYALCFSLWVFALMNNILGGSSPDRLQDVQMTVIGNSECYTRWSSVSGATINDGHICIYQSGKSACSVSIYML